MADVLILGDGPAGLSAALFLAKNGQNATVFGDDKTVMHFAKLYNYLGIDEITGTDFQKISRTQAERFGAKIEDQQITKIEKRDDTFVLNAESGSTYKGQYLILAEGKAFKFAEVLGLSTREAGIVVDHNNQTEKANLYAVGRCTRRNRSQAVISAGDGAVAALDILSKAVGEDFCDFDEV